MHIGGEALEPLGPVAEVKDREGPGGAGLIAVIADGESAQVFTVDLLSGRHEIVERVRRVESIFLKDIFPIVEELGANKGREAVLLLVPLATLPRRLEEICHVQRILVGELGVIEIRLEWLDPFCLSILENQAT